MQPKQVHGQTAEHEASTQPTTMEATQQQFNVSAAIHTERIPRDEPTPPLDNTTTIVPTTEETTMLPPFDDILDILEEIPCTVEFRHGSLSILHFHFDFGVRRAKALSHGCARCCLWAKNVISINKPYM